MESPEISTLRIFTGDDLKISLFHQAEIGDQTDVKLVCQDGTLKMHKPHLLIFIPELAGWIPNRLHSDELIICLDERTVEEVQLAIKQLYLDDSSSFLRSILGFQDSEISCIHLLQDAEYDDENVVEDYPADQTEYEDHETRENNGAPQPTVDKEEMEEKEIFSNLSVENTGERLKYEKLFPCPDCEKVFTTSHYLKIHEKKSHSNSVFVKQHRCLSHPEMLFENINRLTAHFNSEHSQKMIRDLVTKGQVKRHQKKKIQELDLSSETKLLLEQSPIKEKKFSCTFCTNFSSDKKESLDNHIDLCHTPVQCPDCDKLISSKRNLRSHMAYIHKVEGNEHVCQECGKDFPTFQSMKKHYDSKHVIEKRFKCEECSKSYGTKSMLKEHVESKHQSAQYPCSTCGKAFGTKSLLRGHEQTHSDFKKFECDQCEKRFRTREKLRNHQSVHSSLKHPCLMCGSQFSRLETLKVHMRIHDESRALKCLECGKLFDTTQKHKEHMNTHTGDKPFVCSPCGAAFSSSSSLCHHRRNCSYLHKADGSSLESSNHFLQLREQPPLKTEGVFYL